jgi:hypothetical protein
MAPPLHPYFVKPFDEGDKNGENWGVAGPIFFNPDRPVLSSKALTGVKFKDGVEVTDVDLVAA